MKSPPATYGLAGDDGGCCSDNAYAAMKLSYALAAAATRGSAGVELLDVGGVVLPDVPGVVGLPDVLEVDTWLSDALGPGFGVLLLQPATTTAVAAATSAIFWYLRT